MRKLIIVCALVLAVALTGAASAAVQNIKVSGDIEVRAISRDQLDLYEDFGAGSAVPDDNVDAIEGSEDNWYDQTTRIQIEAELTDDVSAVVRLINERDYDSTEDGVTGDRSAGEAIEIDLSSITIDNLFDYSLSVTFGRQEILFGEGALIGDGFNGVVDTLNATGVNDYDLVYGKSSRRAFDAISVTYTSDPYVIDFFTAKIDEDFGAVNTGEVNLYGANLNYNYLDIAVFDLAYVVKEDSTEATPSTQGTVKALSLRGEGEVDALPGLTVKAEYITESGNVGNANSGGLGNVRGTDELDADAWYLGAEYALQDNPYDAYISVTYLTASGDKDTGSPNNDDKQFDPLYEDGELAIIAELLPNIVGGEIQTNYEGWKLGAGLKPTDALSVDIAYAVFDREKTAAGVSDDLFDELDIVVTYDYTEDVQFGLTAAFFDPGKFYTDTYGAGRNDEATQIVGSVKVSF